MSMTLLHLSDEELRFLRESLPDDKATIRYWLTVGIPDGHEIDLADWFPQELIDEVQKEIDT